MPCETDSRGLADSSAVALGVLSDGDGLVDASPGADDEGVAGSAGVDGSAGGAELLGGSDDGACVGPSDDGSLDGSSDGVGVDDGLGGSLVTGGSTSSSRAIEAEPSASGRSTNRHR